MLLNVLYTASHKLLTLLNVFHLLFNSNRNKAACTSHAILIRFHFMIKVAHSGLYALRNRPCSHNNSFGQDSFSSFYNITLKWNSRPCHNNALIYSNVQATRLTICWRHHIVKWVAALNNHVTSLQWKGFIQLGKGHVSIWRCYKEAWRMSYHTWEWIR